MGERSRSSTPYARSRSSTPHSNVYPSKIKQPKMKGFLDNVNDADSEKLDFLLAEFFFGCNVPFHACESKYFKTFINALRPAYTIPNRKKLSNTLLDKVHAKCDRQNGELITKMKKQATLFVDGWTNSSANRHNFVTLLATSDDQKVFLESYDISEIGEK